MVNLLFNPLLRALQRVFIRMRALLEFWQNKHDYRLSYIYWDFTSLETCIKISNGFNYKMKLRCQQLYCVYFELKLMTLQTLYRINGYETVGDSNNKSSVDHLPVSWRNNTVSNKYAYITKAPFKLAITTSVQPVT